MSFSFAFFGSVTERVRRPVMAATALPFIFLDSIPRGQLDDWGKDLPSKYIRRLAARPCLCKKELPSGDVKQLKTLTKLIQHIVQLEPHQHTVEDLLQALKECDRTDVALKVQEFQLTFLMGARSTLGMPSGLGDPGQASTSLNPSQAASGEDQLDFRGYPTCSSSTTPFSSSSDPVSSPADFQSLSTPSSRANMIHNIPKIPRFDTLIFVRLCESALSNSFLGLFGNPQRFDPIPVLQKAQGCLTQTLSDGKRDVPEHLWMDISTLCFQVQPHSLSRQWHHNFAHIFELDYSNIRLFGEWLNLRLIEIPKLDNDNHSTARMLQVPSQLDNDNHSTARVSVLLTSSHELCRGDLRQLVATFPKNWNVVSFSPPKALGQDVLSRYCSAVYAKFLSHIPSSFELAHEIALKLLSDKVHDPYEFCFIYNPSGSGFDSVPESLPVVTHDVALHSLTLITSSISFPSLAVDSPFSVFRISWETGALRFLGDPPSSLELQEHLTKLATEVFENLSHNMNQRRFFLLELKNPNLCFKQLQQWLRLVPGACSFLGWSQEPNLQAAVQATDEWNESLQSKVQKGDWENIVSVRLFNPAEAAYIRIAVEPSSEVLKSTIPEEISPDLTTSHLISPQSLIDQSDTSSSSTSLFPDRKRKDRMNLSSHLLSDDNISTKRHRGHESHSSDPNPSLIVEPGQFHALIQKRSPPPIFPPRKHSGEEPYEDRKDKGTIATRMSSRSAKRSKTEGISPGNDEEATRPSHQTNEWIESAARAYRAPAFIPPPFQDTAIKSSHPIDLLVEVVNDAEWQAILTILKPFDLQLPLQRFTLDQVQYLVGKIGSANAVVVRTGMSGTGSKGSSQMTVRALATWKPSMIVRLGVGFGTPGSIEKRNESSRIGDVMVSTSLHPYEFRRLSAASEQLRALPIPASPQMISALQNAAREMSVRSRRSLLARDDGENFQILFGGLLSGDKLLDNQAIHQKLVQEQSMFHIIGGEMEGYGIVDSIRVANFIPWVVIKGICDWGCGKTLATKQLQIPVALHAAQFLKAAVSTLLNYFPTSSTSRQMLHPWEKLTDMNLSVDSLEFSLLIDQWEHSHEAHLSIVKGPECQTIDQEIADLKRKKASLLKATKDRLDKASESLNAAWNYVLVVVIKDAPGALRLSVQPFPAAFQKIDEFLRHVKKVLKIVTERLKQSVYHGIYLVNLCSGLRLIREGEMAILPADVVAHHTDLSVSHRVSDAPGRYHKFPLHLTLLHFFRKQLEFDTYVCSRTTASADSNYPACVFSHPRLIHPAASEPASSIPHAQPENTRSRLYAAALEFNQQARSPRSGVTREDPDLWGFSAGIQASGDTIRYFERRFEIIRPTLLAIFEALLKEARPVDYPFEFKPEFVHGGSVANKTFLTSPDLDMIMVVNPTQGLFVRCADDSTIEYYGQSSNKGHVVVNEAMVKVMSTACAAAIEQFLASQHSSSPLKPTSFITAGITVFTLQEEEENYSGLRLEFDVMPVLKTLGNNYLLLDGKNGKLVPFSTQLAAHTIGVYAKDFLGLREMMVVLKLVHKAGIKQGLSSLARVPSCALEMAVLLLVGDKRRDCAEWWDISSFTIIFKAAIVQMLERVPSGAPLSAPNSPSDDVLRNIRDNPAEFVTYYSGWQQIPEAALLVELRACFDRVSAGSNIPLVDPSVNQPMCSSHDFNTHPPSHLTPGENRNSFGQVFISSQPSPPAAAAAMSGSGQQAGSSPQWSMEEWLASLGLSKYEKNFRDHDLTTQTLIKRLTTTILRDEIGIASFGARETIVEAAKKLNLQE